MKILLVQDTLRSGGTERQTLLLGRAFAAAGHGASLLTFRPAGALYADGLPRDSLQSWDTGRDWFAPGLGRRASALAPDVVLCMGRMANCYGGRLQERLPRAAVVATMRTGKNLPWLYRRSLDRVRHVVANSQAACDVLLAGYLIPASKISVIRNALVFPPGANGAARENLRSLHGAGPATTVLLCVAMFRPEKKQAELIEIAAGLPRDRDWQLWLAGDGPERAACQALARRHGLEGKVRFLGFVRDASQPYAAADVAVHASDTDSLSNFVIEAQANGLPAVVGASQGMRECLVPDRTGWVLPQGDREGFRATLLARMDDSPAVRAEQGREAREFARTAFDPARQVQAYLDLFQRLIV